MRLRRARWWRLCKWAGVVTCLLLTGACIATVNGGVAYYGDTWAASVTRGNISVEWGDFAPCSLCGARDSTNERLRFWWRPCGFDVNLPSLGTTSVRGWHTVSTSVLVPLWFTALVLASGVVLLFWLDRPFPILHCETCGYNFRGSTSGRCPECGTDRA